MDQVYSHETVWLIINAMPSMSFARSTDSEIWKAFVDAIQMETANVYPWSIATMATPELINRMADDLGSYQHLIDIWCELEDTLAVPFTILSETHA